MQRVVGFLVALVCVAFAFGCAPTDEDLLMDEIGVVRQALDADRRRVIQECSQAMSGSWDTYDETDWPTGTTYGSYAYISSDTGAWERLLDHTWWCVVDENWECVEPQQWVQGWWTSCRSTYDPDVVNYPSPECHLTYGDLDTASLYDCQGSCASANRFHGGQCKPFMNLVAYRSGIYQNSNYRWRSFPSDRCIKYTTATCNLAEAYRVPRPTNDTDMPMATYANIEPGDFLRRPYGHALIVVRKVNSSTVVVLDSNWVGGGDGDETIGSHVLGFTGNDNNSDLGDYRVLKCAYTGNC